MKTKNLIVAIILLFCAAGTYSQPQPYVPGTNLLSTTWGQDYYYNKACPADLSGPNGHVLAGEVAVAMAQIIRYYKWPDPAGLGSLTYSAGNYGQLTADFSTPNYDLPTMPYCLTTNSEEADIASVSSLIYKCGVAVETNYSVINSTADIEKIPEALNLYFRYKPSARLVHRLDYTDEMWAALIKNEIYNKRPVILATTTPHDPKVRIVVVDGYPAGNDNYSFHYNPGFGTSTTSFFLDIHSSSSAVIGIEPDRCSRTLTIPKIFSIAMDPKEMLCPSENVTFTAIALNCQNSTNAPLTYTWLVDGQAIPNYNTSNVILPRGQNPVRISCILNDGDAACSVVSNSILMIPRTKVSNPSSNSPVCLGEPLWLSAQGVAPGGGSVELNGNSQSLKIPGNALVVNDFTYELWVKPTAKNAAPYFEIYFSQTETDPGYSIALEYSNRKMKLEFADHGSITEIVYKRSQLLNTWTHLALVRRGRLLGLYVNGVLAGPPLTITDASLSTNTIFLGEKGQSNYFNGQIDEFRAWNTALSQAEIQAGMLNEVPHTTPLYKYLMRYYKFNTNHELRDEKSGNDAEADNSYTSKPSEAVYKWESINYYWTQNGQEVILDNFQHEGKPIFVLTSTAFSQRENVVAPIAVTIEKGLKPKASSNSPVYEGDIIDLKSESNLVPGQGHIKLDGANQFILTSNLRNRFSSTSVTFEIWFLANAAGVIISERDYNQVQPWHCSLLEAVPTVGNSGTLEIKARVWNLNPISLGIVKVGVWNHAVVRYDSDTRILDGMLNGALSSDISTGTREMPDDGLLYAIGRGETTHMGSGAYFSGELDELRIWNIALSNDVLRSWRNRMPQISHPNFFNLVAHYQFNWDQPLRDNYNFFSGTADYGFESCNKDNYQWLGPSNYTSYDQNPRRGPATTYMSGDYSVNSQSPSGCVSNDSIVTVVVKHRKKPSVVLDQKCAVIDNGGALTATSSSLHGGSEPQYYWDYNAIQKWMSTITHSILSTHTFSSVADGDKIFCVMISNAANVDPVTATSNTITVKLVDQKVVGGASSNSPLCTGSDLRLSVTNALMTGMPGATFQWFGPDDYTSNLPNPIITDITEDMAGSYCVVATSPAGYKKAAFIDVIVTPAGESMPRIETVGWKPEPGIDIQHYAYAALGALLTFNILGPSVIPEGGRWNILEAPADNTTYQWTINGQAVAGATGVSFSNSQLQDMDEVQCIITTNNGCGNSVASNPIFVLNSLSTPLPKPEASYKSPQAGQYILSATGMVPGGGHIELGNATNQYVSGSMANKTLVDLSCEFWVRPKGFTSDNVYFSISAAIPNNNLVLRQATPDTLDIEINKRTYKIAYAPELNRWTHLALIKEGTAITFFVNGVPWDKLVLNSIQPVNMGTLQIGGHTGNPADNTFNGSIDEFRLWNTALSRQTLLSWEDKELTSDHDNYNQLLAYLKFNSGNSLKEEVSRQLFTTPNNYTAAASDYWRYWWQGEHAPSASTLNENVTITLSALEQLCRMYRVVAISPEGIESEWSNELIISDENLAIPGVNATGNGSIGP